MYGFERIEWLWAGALLLPLVLVFFLALRWKRKTRKAIGDEHLVRALTAGYSNRLYWLKSILVFTAFAAGVVSLANLRKPEPGGKEKKAGIDIMIALDVSKSMLAEDVKPTRLDKAKATIDWLIDKLGDNRIGLIVFAGQAYLQMPLTSDASAAKLYLANATPDAVPMQGTVITEALRMADQSFNTKEKKHKAVILLSDGEDHEPGTSELISQLRDNGVVVYSIGVGSKEGSPIREAGTADYKKDMNGQIVVSKLNEEALRTIAEGTGGQYHLLDNSTAAEQAVALSLGQMEKKLVQGGSGTRQYASFYPYFLAFAVLLLVVEVFIPERKKLKP